MKLQSSETQTPDQTPTLDSLFSKDPLHMTTEDINKIVKTLRNQRAAFVKEVAEAKARGRNVRHKMTREQAQAALSKIELDI